MRKLEIMSVLDLKDPVFEDPVYPALGGVRIYKSKYPQSYGVLETYDHPETTSKWLLEPKFTRKEAEQFLAKITGLFAETPS